MSSFTPESIKPLPGTVLSLHIDRSRLGVWRVVCRTRMFQLSTGRATLDGVAEAFARFAADPLVRAQILALEDP